MNVAITAEVKVRNINTPRRYIHTERTYMGNDSVQIKLFVIICD